MELEVLKLLNEIQRSLDIGGKEWMSLISSVIGGTMVLIGSFGVEAYRLSASKKKEIHTVLRDKLEVIGNLANEFEEALQKDFAMILGLASPNDQDIPPVDTKLQNLLLNINLYHHDLSSAGNNLRKACEGYFNTKKILVSEKLSVGKCQEATIQMENERFTECLYAKNFLLKELVVVSGRLLK